MACFHSAGAVPLRQVERMMRWRAWAAFEPPCLMSWAGRLSWPGAEMRRVLGDDIAMRFTQPQLAGGVATSAADYAVMLRKFLGGQLHMGKLLGTNAVCTNPTTCKAAVYTPTPRGEDWQYSVGHWVDADRAVGDGAFSSTGAFGFHPWVDATKTSYGVIARQTKMPGTGFDSAVCGRLLRKAWKTGKVQ